MTNSRLRSIAAALAGLVLVLCGSGAAVAAPGPAPDPRRGERLDGRAPWKDPRRVALAVPRAVLVVPRLLAYVVLKPIERTVYHVEDKKVIERLRLWLTSDDGKVGVRPLARWESDSRPSLGLRIFDRRTLGDDTLMQLRFRTAGTDLFMTELQLEPLGGVPLALTASWDRDPSIRFGGLNGITRDELAAEGRTMSRYRHDRGAVGVAWMPRLSDTVSLTLDTDLTRATYGTADAGLNELPLDQAFCADPGTPGCMDVDEALVPGFHDGTRLWHAGLTLHGDTRGADPVKQRWATGVAANLGGRFANGIAGDPSRHGTAGGDVRFLYGLGERQVTLRVAAALVEPLGDAPVPFDELLMPGGSDGVRGISSHRLRGHSEFVSSVEYRWLLGANLDASLFADYGGAFGRRFDGLGPERMIPAVGVSLRAYTLDKNIYWRIASQTGFSVAWAPGEGFRLLLSISE